MVVAASPIVLQTVTPTPGVGPEELVTYWPMIRRALWFLGGFLAVLGIGWYAVEPVVSRTIRQRNLNNPTIQEAIARYVKLFVVVVAVFIAAGLAGYGRFLTNSAIVIAAATLAIGVAGQTVIGSLISGLVLVLDPEFNIGNYIKWSDGEGTVQSITLRVTRVQTPNGELVTIPNTVLTSSAITRPFGRRRYRIVEHIQLAYEDDIDEAIQLLERAAADIDGVLADPPPRIFVEELGSDAVVCRVHLWIGDPRHRDLFTIRSTFARTAMDRLETAGITISPASKRDLAGRIQVDEAA